MAEKKQVPLRLSAALYDAIAAWAEDDFRSVNGQIEYLLTECVKQRKKNGKYVSDDIDAPMSWILNKGISKYKHQRRRYLPLPKENIAFYFSLSFLYAFGVIPIMRLNTLLK